MKRNFSLLALVMIFVSLLFLQSCGGLKFSEGDFNFMKGENVLNVEYDYSNMGVGKYENEKDYVDKKVADMNESEAGKGDKWAGNWKNDRTTRFQPAFEAMMERYFSKKDWKMSANPNAKYTLIFKTTHTEPGFNIGIMRKPANISAEAIFVETKNKQKVMAKILMEEINGGDPTGGWGFDFDTGLRIEAAYRECGRRLGKFLISQE